MKHTNSSIERMAATNRFHSKICTNGYHLYTFFPSYPYCLSLFFCIGILEGETGFDHDFYEKGCIPLRILFEIVSFETVWFCKLAFYILNTKRQMEMIII